MFDAVGDFFSFSVDTAKNLFFGSTDKPKIKRAVVKRVGPKINLSAFIAAGAAAALMGTAHAAPNNVHPSLYANVAGISTSAGSYWGAGIVSRAPFVQVPTDHFLRPDILQIDMSSREGISELDSEVPYNFRASNQDSLGVSILKTISLMLNSHGLDFHEFPEADDELWIEAGKPSQSISIYFPSLMADEGIAMFAGSVSGMTSKLIFNSSSLEKLDAFLGDYKRQVL